MDLDKNLILIKPDDIIGKGAIFFSQQIIDAIMKSEEVDVIGFGTSIFLTCSAVNISTNIANIHIHDISLDYIEIPVIGKNEVILFTLKNFPPEKPLETLAKEIDKRLNLSFSSNGQLIVVSRKQNIEKMVTLCLWKLSKMDEIKLMAGGTAINNAVKIALILSKGGIAKEPVSIKLISLETFQRSRVQPPKPITGISIYLGKGQTEIVERHRNIINYIKSKF